MGDKIGEIIYSIVQLIKNFFSKPKELPPVIVNDPNEEPVWLKVARGEFGVVEGRDNLRIVLYHSATSLKSKDPKTPWCSSFINWCLKVSGVKGTNSAWARNFLQWGSPLVVPRKGCICVIERNEPGGDSHVFFWLGEENGKVLGLGGNQGNRVCIMKYDKARVLGYRWPSV